MLVNFTMTDFLENIIAHKKKLNRDKAPIYEKIKRQIEKTTYSRYRLFSRMISSPDKIHLIAEIKKASPSQGLLREDFDVLEIAKVYAAHGASAFSVLTEDKYFLGNPGYVKKVVDNFKLPVLTKDFTIDEGQIYEARVNGSSAILLIMAILTDDQAKHFLETAHKLDLDCLVEIHDQKELDRALDCDAEMIGINNRDLHSFKVDINTSVKLIPQIPEGKIIVAESGIKTHDDVLKFKKLGAHAVLIGETFMREKDIGRKVDELMKGKK